MRFLAIYLFSIVLFSCANPATPLPRGENLAKSLCSCTAQLLTLNHQAQSASDSLVFRNIADEFEKAKACAAGLGINSDDRVQLKVDLQTFCPSLSAQDELLLELLGGGF